MAWIKRNLFFTIGSVIALLLLGAAAFYNFKSWSHNRDAMANLQEAYNTLANLYNKTPAPGNDQIDNIKAAKDQEAQVRQWIDQAHAYFVPIPPIPNPPDGVVTTEAFAGNLRKTVRDLQEEAKDLNIDLPPDYSFSFAAERNLVTFAPGSLNSLASHLGEVKVLCEILYSAKINGLDSIQREIVSDNDATGPQADYLADKTTTVDNLATLTPYLVTFRCFSSDLADLLGKLAASKNGFVVKGINVMPAGAVTATAGAPAPPPPPPEMAVSGGGLQTVLDEQLLRVTLAVEVVKLSKQ